MEFRSSFVNVGRTVLLFLRAVTAAVTVVLSAVAVRPLNQRSGGFEFDVGTGSVSGFAVETRYLLTVLAVGKGSSIDLHACPVLGN